MNSSLTGSLTFVIVYDIQFFSVVKLMTQIKMMKETKSKLLITNVCYVKIYTCSVVLNYK